MTLNQHLGILDGLRRSISKLNQRSDLTEWANYYSETNYDDIAFKEKKELVGNYLKLSKAQTVWDVGGNTGEFSRIASQQGLPTISFDIDPNAIEANYIFTKQEQSTNILPLVLDLTNPSPNLGWNNEERISIYERKSPDMIFALALIHHMAISNNLPLERLASFFSKLAPWLIIEFVPKSDSQVKRLLSSRTDIFPEYTIEGFKRAFATQFEIRESQEILNSDRTLFLMKRK
jgi:ribosomal protein L11 methylase PrmA